METFNEKRNSERFYLKAPIQYIPANANEPRRADMFNCSEGGLYFETGTPIDPGVDVVVSGIEHAKFFKAKTKWCKRVGPKDKNIYGVGAQYYD